MCGLYRCERCGSAGSIEFGMCQVCLHDYARSENGPFLEDTLRDKGETREKGAMDRGIDAEKEMMAAV